MEYKAPYELVKGHETDSGYDIRVIDADKNFIGDICIIPPFSTVLVNTGVYLKIDPGYEVQVRPKSSLSSEGIQVAFGTVDEEYRGEVKVVLYNNTADIKQVKKMQKVAQLVFKKKDEIELIKVDEIDQNTNRSDRGFGSTGKF